MRFPAPFWEAFSVIKGRIFGGFLYCICFTKADIGTQPRDVRFVPKADIMHRSKNPLFD
jgi:hypothetical protein